MDSEQVSTQQQTGRTPGYRWNASRRWRERKLLGLSEVAAKFMQGERTLNTHYSKQPSLQQFLHGQQWLPDGAGPPEMGYGLLWALYDT